MMLLNDFPRFPLTFLPTPIEPLTSLSKYLGGPRILIKRDDQTGLAFGGNKARKLEFLLGDALKKEVDTLVTMGSIQSNHCRQTAAAAAKAGLRCELLLKGAAPEVVTGNVLLDKLLNAKISWTDQEVSNELLKKFTEIVNEKGFKPYMIPYGGSCARGALGYVNAMFELDAQLKLMGESIDHIVFASSSGGTQAGITVGAALTQFSGVIHGIAIAKNDMSSNSLGFEFAKIAMETTQLLGIDKTFSESDLLIHQDYFGGGYAVMDELEKNAIHLMARHEGILLDPVYTGRAFGALIDLIEKKQFSSDETILFWHTGGTPALFAYAEALSG